MTRRSLLLEYVADADLQCRPAEGVGGVVLLEYKTVAQFAYQRFQVLRVTAGTHHQRADFIQLFDVIVRIKPRKEMLRAQVLNPLHIQLILEETFHKWIGQIFP